VLIEPFEHDSAAFNHGANETGVWRRYRQLQTRNITRRV